MEMKNGMVNCLVNRIFFLYLKSITDQTAVEQKEEKQDSA